MGIEPGNNVVVDGSGIGQVLGTGPEVPIAAKYHPHPITQNLQRADRLLAGESVTANQAGANNRSRRTLSRRAPSVGRTDIKSLMTSGRVSEDEGT